MPTTIVFPGQGSQKTGMCKDFYDASDIVKNTFKEASDSLGYSMEDLCFVENEYLNLTEYTQPALLTCEVAMWNYMKNRGFKADYYAGHSLGEYSALVAAGVITLSDAVKIVRRRGGLMQRAVPQGVGSMKVLNFPVGFDASSKFENIKMQCNLFDVDLANINSPRQVVLSGPITSLQDAAESSRALFADENCPDIIDIPVSAPFHSRGMKIIEDEFKSFIDEFNFDLSEVGKVFSNKTGQLHNSSCFFDNLVSQISSPVNWVENMEKIKNVSDKIIEIGPGKPLSGFFKSLNTSVTSIMILRQADSFLKGL